jgi:hypothetical protein
MDWMRARNLLIIMSDQHNRNTLGCYGHPLVETPSLDRPAAAGTLFTEAYTPCPVCVPARAAFATGKYVHQIGLVLVLQTAKGGVATAWMLREMPARGMGPKAIIFDRTNTILAQGAAFVELTWSTASRPAIRRH